MIFHKSRIKERKTYKMITIIELQSVLQNLKKEKITYTDIGNALGTTRSNVSKRAISGSKLTADELDKIEKYFNLPSRVENGENFLNTFKNYSTNVIDDCIGLPVRGNLSASMGYGIEIYDEGQTGVYKISAKVLKDIGANPKQSDIIFAEGDSMEPTIQGGSALIVDKSRTDVKDGKIYCINFNGALMAKRLQLLPPKKLRVISDNFNKYPAWDVDFSKEIDFNFKVVGEVMRWMTNAR